MTDIHLISERIAAVMERIERATAQAGRTAGAVRLIAVSKRMSAEAVHAAYAAGLRDFGENYAQELSDKAERLKDLPDLKWHMIGHLQRNKVNKVSGVAHMLHTVDSAKLATALEQRLAGEGRATPLPVLIEVNVGGEAQKHGAAPAQLGELLGSVQECQHLALCGLMTVPPFTDDIADARRTFDALAALRDQHGGPARLPELSMGMSGDLEAAIAAGATMVRVGTAIFGARS